MITNSKPELCECGQPENSIRHSFATASSIDAHAFKPADKHKRVAERLWKAYGWQFEDILREEYPE